MLYDEILLNSEQAKIDECYTQIGLRYYAYYKENPAPEFADLVATITQSKQAIAAHKAEVLRANGKIVCPNCGQQINATSIFCNCCGLRIAAPAASAPVAASAATAVVAAPSVEAGVPAMEMPEELVVEEPVAEEPVAEEPVVEEPVAEEPIAEEPVAEEPVAEEPVAEEPVVEEPVAEEPVAEEPWTCRQCGSVMAADCLFCMECGARKDAETADVPEEPAANDIFSDSAARVCKSCGFTVADKEAMFCTNCGARLEEAPATASAPAHGKKCPSCGFFSDDPEVLFCIECGTKLTEV